MTSHRTHLPTPSPANPADMAVDHLDRLNEALIMSGWNASVSTPADRWPYVHVVNPYMRALNENVAAAPDTEGRWFFWWSWAEPVAEAGDIPRALARISRVLALDNDR